MNPTEALAYLKRLFSQQKLPQVLLWVEQEIDSARLHAQMISLAQTILCQTANACGICQSCVLITHHALHPDLKIISLDEKINIDLMRSLVSFAEQSPYLSLRRWVVIEDAEKINSASAHVLLKTLESLPSTHAFILVARHPRNVFMTIKSRCHLVRVVSNSRVERARQASQKNTSTAAYTYSQCFESYTQALRLGDFKHAKKLEQQIQQINRVLGWQNLGLVLDQAGVDEYIDGEPE
jgi:DNA polymerase III delta prime subunit